MTQQELPDSDRRRSELLHAELTPELLGGLRSFARRRQKKLRIRAADDYPSDIVAGVVTDTITGVLTWHPERCRLTTHLYWAVKSRTHKEMLRQRTYQVFALDQRQHIKLAGTAPSPEAQLAARQRCAEILPRLLATLSRREDQLAIDIITALQSGTDNNRTELAELLDVTPLEIDRARDRIHRCARRLFGGDPFQT